MAQSAGRRPNPKTPDTSFGVFLLQDTRKRLREAVADRSNPKSLPYLKPVLEALAHDALSSALRHADRAWRALGDESPAIAPLYGRLLLIRGEDYYAAHGLMQRTIQLAQDPDTQALMGLCLLRLGRFADAREHVHAVLRSYCVEPSGAIARVAGEIRSATE